VAISANGKLMTKEAAPASYHLGYWGSPNFSVDLDRDGWTTGVPNYFGGWFSELTPVEYWGLDVDGRHYAPLEDDYLFTVSGDTGYISGVAKTPAFTTVSWQGNFGGVAMRQSFFIDRSAFFVRVDVQLKNNTSATKRNIYYMRESESDFVNLDTRASNTVSYNRIVSQADSGMACVRQTAESFWRGILHMASTDCRARAYFLPTGLRADTPLDSLYHGLGRASSFYTTPGDSTRADVGIGLVFKIDSLKPGDSTSFRFWYVFEESYDIAPLIARYQKASWQLQPPFYEETRWGWTGDTVQLCSSDSATISISDANRGWVWLPNPKLGSLAEPVQKVPIKDTETYKAVFFTDACGQRDTFQITIIGLPTPNPDLIVSGDRLSTSKTYKTYGWRRYGYDLGVNTPTYRMRVPGCYSIWVIDSNGCLGSSDTICYKLAIDEMDPQYEVQIFPNPASEYLNVICAFTPSLQLLDVSGRLLRQCNSCNQIPVKDLSGGVYLLRVLDGDDRLRAIQKFVRE
jgi:hypothetical protein